MAYVVISRYSRPDANIKWHTDQTFDKSLTEEVMKLMFEQYHGKKVRTIEEVDPLTLSIEYVWDTKELFEEWAAQPVILRLQGEIEKYNSSVGITAQPKEKFEI